MMKKIFMISFMVLLLSGCMKNTGKERKFCLQGTWLLQKVEYPAGEVYDHFLKDKNTYCRIYGEDSMYYQCKLKTTDRGLVIMPTSMIQTTLINKGGGEMLYFEDGDPHPLTLSGDTAMTIQQIGVLYTWKRANDIDVEWGQELRYIIADEMKKANLDTPQTYVLSAKERQQKKTIHWLTYAICLIILVAIHYVVTSRKSRQRLRLQLQQIQEEHEKRSQHVKQAIMADEKQFFASDEYNNLYERITNGQSLTKEEWTDVEQMLKTVYPGFTSQLRGLHHMSELEYQTCLLIKLRIPPKDIANVLIRDTSTISTVRSGLYKKVFGRKGSTKEWDDFILSIGV